MTFGIKDQDHFPLEGNLVAYFIKVGVLTHFDFESLRFLVKSGAFLLVLLSGVFGFFLLLLFETIDSCLDSPL